MANGGAVRAVDTQHAQAVLVGSRGNLHQQRGADPHGGPEGATDPTGLYTATTTSAKKWLQIGKDIFATV